MSESVQRSKAQQTRRDEVVEEEVVASTQAFDVESILDEIDAVLESDAEEFVRGFVQKGGQ